MHAAQTFSASARNLSTASGTGPEDGQRRDRTMPDHGPRSGPNATDLHVEWQRRDHLPLGLGVHNRETLEGRIELAAPPRPSRG